MLLQFPPWKKYVFSWILTYFFQRVSAIIANNFLITSAKDKDVPFLLSDLYTPEKIVAKEKMNLITTINFLHFQLRNSELDLVTK